MPGNQIDREIGNLRRSTVVQTFGPGSIVDFRAEGAPISAVIAGLEEWDSSFRPAGLANEQKVYEARLQKNLGVAGFRLPPVIDEQRTARNGGPDSRSLVAVRFPTWLQCPRCDRISPSYKWLSDPGQAACYCPECTTSSPGQRKVFVIPVRFVMACDKGHLDEFPWDLWVGHAPECKNRGKLTLKSKRPGLAGLELECPECKAKRSMEGIFDATNWKGFRCKGRRPWLRRDDEDCDLQPRVLQRGASNLYFPVLESALSIPPWSDQLQEELGSYWADIVNIPDREERARFISILAQNSLRQALENLNLSPEKLADILEPRYNQYNSSAILNLREEEYHHFVAGHDIRPEEGGEFELRNVQVPDSLRSYFSHIVRVVRLREVRAIRGFTRIKPPEDGEGQNIAPIYVRKPNWLPAIEVRGEGIYLEFEPDHLHRWERQQVVQDRARNIQARWQSEWIRRYGGGESSPVITPRYLLVHTWAHALMRQLTLECGYSSASLRERLYVSEGDVEMAGVLIYTATSDSDGTLGGLQRQGEAGRISPIVRAAVSAMEWCSSDPLCIEGMIAAPDHYSLAACHACCLAPETSCEQYNRFLDRATLVGLPDMPDAGYFSSILQEERDWQ